MPCPSVSPAGLGEELGEEREKGLVETREWGGEREREKKAGGV